MKGGELHGTTGRRTEMVLPRLGMRVLCGGELQREGVQGRAAKKKKKCTKHKSLRRTGFRVLQEPAQVTTRQNPK